MAKLYQLFCLEHNGKAAMSAHNSATAPEPIGHYPHARRVGNLLFLSGIGPRKRNSRKIPGVMLDSGGNVLEYDIETQTRAVFENVRDVLEAAGARWEDLVDVTVYLTNMRDDFDEYNRLWAEYFPANPPCRTTLGIDSLPTPIAIELKCIAVVKD
jgi:2-aminomuconate deaminase